MMEKMAVSMVLSKIHAFNALPLLIIIQHLSLLEVAGDCPENFENVGKYCYIRKGPERFSDKFVNCKANVFTTELTNSWGLPDSEPYWTDYTSVFPGSATLLDWSYTAAMRNTTPLDIKAKGVTGENNVSLNDVICVVNGPDNKLSMVRCDEPHYRYCVVEQDADTIKQQNVTLTLTKEDKYIKLTLSYSASRLRGLDENKIMCFKDCETYYPKIVGLEPGPTDSYLITPSCSRPGYYWCTHSDLKNFYVSTSNKLLFIDITPEQLNRIYAVKLNSSKSYEIDDTQILSLLNNNWSVDVLDYIYYNTEYSKTTEENYDFSDVVKYKKEHPSTASYFDIIEGKMVVVRLYMDSRTALLHVTLKPGMKPVKPGQWNNTFIEYMRPVYYCDKGNNFSIGMNRSVPGNPCVVAKCAHTYSEGVEEIMVPKDGCSADPKKFEREDVVTEMGKILSSPNPFTLKSVDGLLSRADNILGWKNFEINGHFLSKLDDIAARVDLNGTLDSKAVMNNIAVLVADSSPSKPVTGFRVADIAGGKFTTGAFNIFYNKITDINSTLANSEMVVFLPNSVSSIKRRVSFLLFRNNNPFQEKYRNSEVNSQVISVKVENLTYFVPGQDAYLHPTPISSLGFSVLAYWLIGEETIGIDIHMKPFKLKEKRSQNRTCGFWQFHDDGTGSWSQEGCNFTRASQENQLDLCQCNHLTHFAEILVPRTKFSKIHEDTLEILSVIGCCVSIFGLLLVGLTAALFRSWRKEFTNKVWLQLCISILILTVCFLIKVFVQFKEHDYFCPITGVTLHYSVLSSFCWMLVAAVVSYRKLVAVLSVDPTHKLLRASVFAWGVPLVVVGILLSVAPHSYDGQYDEKSPSGTFCYPSGLALWLAVYAPIALTLLINLTLFVLIVRSVFGNKKRPNFHKQTDRKEAYRCATVSCVLVFLFGLPWILGLLSSNIICSYLFTIFATFQGLILFIFFVGTKKTRDLWLVKLNIKKSRGPATTTTTEVSQAITKPKKTRPRKKENGLI